MHLTVLNVRTLASLGEAVRDVARSGQSASALAYRRRRGEIKVARVAVIIQPLVVADVAGVLFTRDPVSGAIECLIEAAWGLGESVVAGRVIPDRYRLAASGRPLERRSGYKATAVRPREGGGTTEVPVLGAGQDVEWAFAQGRLVLLQSRPITTLAAVSRP